MFNKFEADDRVVVVSYPDDGVEVGTFGTVIKYDGMYYRVSLDSDNDEDSDYGVLFEPEEIKLLADVFNEIPYDPTQMGDQDDDI